MGFEKTMNAILDNLPTEDRQTLLFSATQTRSVKGKRERKKKIRNGILLPKLF